MVIKVMRPQMNLVLVEARRKKCAFLRHLIYILGLKEVRVINSRAEDLAEMPEHRGTYDLALSRATAPLPKVLQLCLPLLKRGGALLTPQGAEARKRREEAVETGRKLGAGSVRWEKARPEGKGGWLLIATKGSDNIPGEEENVPRGTMERGRAGTA